MGPTANRLSICWQLHPEIGLAASGAYAQLRQIAMTTDRLGFDGLQLPAGTQPEEAWTYAAAVAPFTSQLRFLLPLRPGSIAVPVAARLAASLNRVTEGRVLLLLENDAARAGLSPDGSDPETAAFLSEWLRHTDAGGLDAGQRRLPLWLPGSALANLQVMAEHGDTYIIAGRSPVEIGSRIALARTRATAIGRVLRFAVRLHLVVRPTDEQAAIAASTLPRRELAPILAGSPGLVAARLAEYQAAGVKTVIASGLPPLDEASRVAELLFPVLRAPAAIAPDLRFTAGFPAEQRMLAQ